MARTKQFGGLSGRQMALILGVPETRVNQAAIPALDRAAVIAMKNPIALLRALVDRMENPTPGMRDILQRRQRLIERMRSGPLLEEASI